MSVRIALTLAVRDEVDVVEPWLRYHFARGVDVVIATDHGSSDGTTEVLREEERAGRLQLIRREAGPFRQAEWVTEMARLAATLHGADWVIHSDADEFWWPRGGQLSEIFAAVPSRFGVVRGLWRSFVLRPNTDEPFWERMTFRVRPSADFRTPYHAQVKVAHRAVPDAVVSGGNHDAYGHGLALIREWMPFDVLHFPLRTRDQLEDKFLRRMSASTGDHIVEAIRRLQEDDDGGAAFARSLSYDGEALRAGLASGELSEDTRLRDALRKLDAGQTHLEPWIPTAADDVDLAVDLQTVLERDSWANLDRRAAALQRAVDRTETLLSVRYTAPRVQRAAT